MSEYSKNRANYPRFLVDQKLIIFKDLINEEAFYVSVACQRGINKKPVFCYKESKFKQ